MGRHAPHAGSVAVAVVGALNLQYAWAQPPRDRGDRVETVVSQRQLASTDHTSRPTDPPSEGNGRTWYGGQTLAVDSAVAVTALLSMKYPSALVLPVAGYPLGTPVVHLTHGNVGSAIVSFGLRAAASVAAYHLVMDCFSTHVRTDKGSCDEDATTAEVTGIVLTAPVFDALASISRQAGAEKMGMG